MPLTKNRRYTWSEILALTSAESGPVFYLLYRKGTEQIAACCLNITLNPRAPYEIIPANKPLIRKRAEQLIAQEEPVPVFVRELDSKWYFRGFFTVKDQSTDSNELGLRELQAKRTNLHKILFLEEVR